MFGALGHRRNGRFKLSSDKEKDEGGSLKELTVAPALTALLKPTAEYLGLELRDYVKSRVEEWKERRRAENLHTHIEGVKKKLEGNAPSSSSGESTSFYQLALFDEWMSNVQDIDPADKELSDLWQSLLASAARGARVPAEVVSALKTLSPKEAQFLVDMSRRAPPVPFLSGSVSGENRYLANSLETKRILEKDYAFSVLFLSSLVFSGLFAYYFFQQQLGGGGLETSIPIIGTAIAVGVAFVGFSMRTGLARWRLTWLGHELLNFVSRGEGRFGPRAAQQSAQADGAASGGPVA